MAILLFGATGMLGQAIAAEARRRGHALAAVSRHGPDWLVDLAETEDARTLMRAVRPDLKIAFTSGYMMPSTAASAHLRA